MKERYFVLITIPPPKEYKQLYCVIKALQDEILELNNSEKEYSIVDLTLRVDFDEYEELVREKSFPDRIEYFTTRTKLRKYFY